MKDDGSETGLDGDIIKGNVSTILGSDIPLLGVSGIMNIIDKV